MNATAMSQCPGNVMSPKTPGNVWQAYALAMALNESAIDCIGTIPSHGRKNNVEKKVFLKEGKKEAEALKERMQYYLNVDLYNFYQSGGQLQTQPAEPNDNSVDNAIDYFISSLRQRIGVQTGMEVADVCMQIRNDLCRLYKLLASSYTRPEMQKVFTDIYTLSKQSNYNVHNELELTRMKNTNTQVFLISEK